MRASLGFMQKGSEQSRPPDDDDRVPVFGTWSRIYAAVVACILLVMGLIALFQRWPW
jgi:hypothetical protein